MSFTAIRNKSMTLWARASILLCMTILPISVVSSASASEFNQSRYGIFFDRHGLPPFNGMIQDNGLKAFKQVPPRDMAAAFPASLGGTLALLLPSVRPPTSIGEWEFSTSHGSLRSFQNNSNLNIQPPNIFNRSAEWSLERQDQRLLGFSALWGPPMGDAGGATRLKHRSWLTRILGHVEVLPTPSSPVGAAGWPIR
jgi:hypothetical protein